MRCQEQLPPWDPVTPQPPEVQTRRTQLSSLRLAGLLQYHARILDSTEPVVTRWDNSPPDQTERSVGTFDVTPTEGGVHVAGAADREVGRP